MFHGKKIVVVMPAYNAAKTIEKTYREIPLDLVDEVVVTDDASSDETVEVAERLGLQTRVHGTNRGYGGNQKTCYQAALDLGADVTVMLHPDYQYTPKLLPAMISMLTDGPFDVVLGSRIIGGSARKGGMPLYKYVANRFLTATQNLLCSAKLSEYHTGYRAFTREVLEQLPLLENSDDFVFDNQMLAQILLQRFEMVSSGWRWGVGGGCRGQARERPGRAEGAAARRERAGGMWTGGGDVVGRMNGPARGEERAEDPREFVPELSAPSLRGGRAARPRRAARSAESSAPIVFHCAAGKDRTGVISALLLSLLGVPRETIVMDYALSRQNLEQINARLSTSPTYQDFMASLPPDAYEAEPATMEGFLDRVAREHGSMQEWAAGVGIGPDIVAGLRARLLEADA